MDLLIGFLVFLAAMVCALIFDLFMPLALCVGLLAFAAVALHRGFSLKSIGGMLLRGARKSFVVLKVFFFIGLITGTWRASGTIAYCVYHGIRLIPPQLFLLIAFLLTALLAFALGTSFGVISTIGVILMTVARGSGVSPTLAAGAILSGAYFGDRAAPASSSANLVAGLTDTKLYANVKLMLRTCLLPFSLAVLIELALSLLRPAGGIDISLIGALADTYTLTPLLLLPAVLMLVLPLCKVPVRPSMACSSAAALLLGVFVQHQTWGEALRCCALGYTPPAGPISELLAGGGLVSMLKVSLIVMLSCCFSGIFDGTGMLSGIRRQLERLADRCGLTGAAAVVSMLCCMIFCNQTIGVVMTHQLIGELYQRRGESRSALALDLENTCIVFAAGIPWNIACAVPLEMMGVSAAAVLCAFYLWLLPLCWFFTRHKFFPAPASER